MARTATHRTSSVRSTLESTSIDVSRVAVCCSSSRSTTSFTWAGVFRRKIRLISPFFSPGSADSTILAAKAGLMRRRSGGTT